MMKKALFNTSLFLFFLAGLLQMEASAQTFRVLAASGNIMAYPKGNTSDKTKLMSGKTIEGNQIIKLNRSAHLGLLYENGRTIELKKPGKYSTSKLAQSMKKNSSSTTARYFAYIDNELSKEDNDMSENHRQYMAVTGSVERSVSLTDAAVSNLSPKWTDIAFMETTLYWEPKEGAEEYEVTFYNYPYKDRSKTVFTDQPSLFVNLQEMAQELVRGRRSKMLYTVKVKGQDASVSDDVFLQVVDEKEEKTILASLDHVTGGQNPDALSSMEHVARAIVFEEHNMYLNAVDEYKMAIEKSPEVDDYKNLYEKFLTRVGIKNPATDKEEKE